jgi:hypothetical protein
MSAVSKITPHLSSMKAPAEIAQKPIWLIWRYEHADNEKKPRKVPYWANGGRRYGVHGRPEDRNGLVTFEAARAAAARRGFTGVGLATLDGDFTVLDFDRCMVDGKLNPDIEKLAAGTYGEYSPSGEGVHIFVRGNLTGNNKSIASKDQFGIEAFATKGFVTFTGQPLEVTALTGAEDTISEPGKELTDLVRLRFGSIEQNFSEGLGQKQPLGLSYDVIQEALSFLDTEMHYDEWIATGMAIHHETNGEGFTLWDEWSKQSSKYSCSEYGQAKWDSFGRNPSAQITVRSLIQKANMAGASISVSAISMEDFDDLDVAETLAKLGVELPSGNKGVSFKVENWKDFAIQASWRYLIKGVLPAAGLGVLYGESGSGKSFITLDMAVAIARGAEWRGKRTTQGRVVYVVAEGATGFRNRLIAYARSHGLESSDIPLDFIDATPNLMDVSHAKAVCAAIAASGDQPSMVVIDTLAQTMAGANENSSEDMGMALRNCRSIHRATGALVLLVHHSGKDSSRGARGWSGLRAAADVELEVTRSSKGRMLRTTKQKDGADYVEYGFTLEVVHLGEDQDGDTVTSCVAVETAVPSEDTKLSKASSNKDTILNALSELLIGAKSVSVKELLDYAEKPNTSKSTDKVYRQSLAKALRNLCQGEQAVCGKDAEGNIYMLRGKEVA